MKRFYFFLVLLLMIAGCSNSPTSKLKSGDVSVCADGDVLEELFDIFKANSKIPNGSVLSSGKDEVLANALSQLDFSADNATIIEMDSVNRRAVCNAKIIISSDGLESKEDYVDYAVISDLTNGGVIVKSNISSIMPKLNNLIGQLTNSEIETAKAELNEENERRADSYEESWSINNAKEVEIVKANEFQQMPPGRFAQWEAGIIIRKRILDRQCNMTSGEEQKLICQRSRDLSSTVGKDFCNSMGSWYHCNSQEEQEADYKERVGITENGIPNPDRMEDGQDQ